MRNTLAVLCAFSGLFAFQGRAAAASICDANPKNLIANCGFETGTFSSWTLTGTDVPVQLGNLYGVESIDPLDGISPFSGSFQAYFADLDANATSLSQSIATKPNDIYQISFYLAQDTAITAPYSNVFSVAFAGTKLTSLAALPVQGYTKYTFLAITEATSTPLSFSFGDDLGQLLLDDVVVTDLGTPEPGTWLLFSGAGMLMGIARIRQSGRRAAPQSRT